MFNLSSLLQAGGQALGFGGDDNDNAEERTRQDRMQRYREAMERARSYGSPSGVPSVMAQMGALHQAGGAHLQGAANQAMSAIQDENQSRVAQLREMRRMEHEKELMRMRVAAQEKESEGDIIRSLLNGR